MEESNALVSIIMPAFNSERYIAQAIASVQAQTYHNWELLTCDDGSSDRTREVILSFRDTRIRYTGETERLGAFGAKNVLIQSARGTYVAFLDADDFMDPRRIELQLAALQSCPSTGMVGCQVGYVNPHGRVMRVSSKPESYDEVLASIRHKNVIGDASLMIKREVLREVGGGFREYFGKLSYQDYDLSLLIAERYECFSLPQVLYYYRQHDTSTSKALSTDRLLAREIVVHLAGQRQATGKDDLMLGRSDRVDELFEVLRKPYAADRSRVFREYAASYLYAKLFAKAIRASTGAVLANPFKFDNWRTLQHCLRVSLIGK